MSKILEVVAQYQKECRQTVDGMTMLDRGLMYGVLHPSEVPDAIKRRKDYEEKMGIKKGDWYANLPEGVKG